MDTGDLISLYRKQSGMTIDELAQKSGVPKGTLNKIIGGVTKAPTLDNMKSISRALGKTLADFDEDRLKISKSASPYSGEAQKLAKDYDSLDNWGKQAVRDLTDVELARVEDESRFFQNAETEQDSKIINLYLEPAAAGIATPLVGQDYEPYELGPDDPAGAAFAIRIQGDSMEPHFPDGSTVFVNHDALADGDIGVFCVDGGTVCKQYHYDRVLGITYLFSLNRDRADCDVVITSESNQPLVCQGRVMTKKRYSLPSISL